MRRIPLACLLLIGCAADDDAWAQTVQPDSTDQSSTSTESGVDLFPPQVSYLGLVYTPLIRYSSLNGFGVGGELLRRFRLPMSPAGTIPSELNVAAIYTFKNRIKAEAKTELNLCNDCLALKAKATYRDFARRFWGLGPDTPTENEEIFRPRDFLAYVELFKQYRGQIRIGVRYEYEYHEVLEKEPDGQLASGDIPGVDCHSATGAGIILELDRRNQRYSPTKGLHYQSFVMLFSRELGGDCNFQVFNLDLRHYFPLGPGHVFALQFFGYTARGAAPFWRYAELGGRHHTRGYRKGRYLDHALVAFQGEYRFPLWWRLSGVLYGGLASIGPRLGDLDWQYYRPTVGVGLRFMPKTSRDVKIRLDMAFGQEDVRFYFRIDEAF